MKIKLTQSEIDSLAVVGRIKVVKAGVFGVGFNDVGFQIRVDGNSIWQYSLWQRMLERCFCQKYKAKKPTYTDVTVCDQWLYFGNFFEWVNQEVEYRGKLDGFGLDKDLLVRGNKVYKPDVCAIVPKQINSLLTSCAASRGQWPVGVCLHKRVGRFSASVCRDGKQFQIGFYNTSQEAFVAYKIAKEAQIKVIALQYKDVLKPAVFESLMNWEIEP